MINWDCVERTSGGEQATCESTIFLVVVGENLS
jgi:hypothetical protein